LCSITVFFFFFENREKKMVQQCKPKTTIYGAGALHDG